MDPIFKSLFSQFQTKNAQNLHLIHNNIFKIIKLVHVSDLTFFFKKNTILNKMTVVCICWLKLWELNYNAWNVQYKTQINLVGSMAQSY